jgi:hypothetical protein
VARNNLFDAQWLSYNKAEYKAEKERFYRPLAPQSKRCPTKCAEIERKRMGKTVDKTRSRSRINGNEPEDREQGAGAHCRNRKYIVLLAGHVLANGEAKEDFRSGRSRGRGGVLAGSDSTGSLEQYSVNKPAARKEEME